MRLRSTILTLAGCVLCLAAASGAVQAQPIQGFYVGGGAGLRMAFPARATSLEPGVPGTFELREGIGYNTQLSIGYALGDGWRFELEGTYGRGGVASVASTPYPAASSGSVRNLGFMANALFDMDVRSSYVYPYLGVGVGYMSTRLDNFSNTPISKPGSFSASGTTGAPAGQVIGGLSFPIPNMPGLSLTADYRVMGILGGGKYDGASTIGLAPGSAPAAGSIKLHSQFIQNVMFGVRYAFNTPPPAAADAPQAAAAPGPETRSYEVAFDPSRITLSDRAQVIVRNAALASTRQGTTRIAVTGNEEAAAADRLALSGRRVKTVVAALLADGVRREEIAIQASEDAGSVAGARDRRIEIVTR
jgi:opacity protein-like surface antigen